ncbi:hypothetical protein HCN44_007405 [Aphidius gifuensis]|uniref:Transmembrane protein 47 n=1 Tax=Aphidius gifuensis TaxID=684658 RepID=A0A834XPJ1_APHGI|nr:transmembrane protein 47 isoform X2 [Aphidius gifuensis]XP_044015258.1 transmembrane protein 47 isoform X2 [Aphidius gifuensis]KAF7989095.1 hypothetical protein HCN44_007405 [Aphidius gifuensis]
MAQTTVIETVTVVRPLKLIAFICGVMVILLMIIGILSPDWLLSVGWRQGLLSHCWERDAPKPLPFNFPTNEPEGCLPARKVTYIGIAFWFCIICLITDICATILTLIGLRVKERQEKIKWYKFAVISMALSLSFLLGALIIYPVCFAAELNLGNRSLWEFGWAYGVVWGAAIFLIGGIVLLLCDKESEEIYYKERKVVREDVTGGNGSMLGHANNHHGTLRNSNHHA